MIVIKPQSSNAGRVVTVIDANWHGMVKVDMEGETKTYTRIDLIVEGKENRSTNDATTISPANLAGLCRDMEIDINEDEIKEIMKAEDTDGDGTLDFDEFLSLLNGAGAGRELVEVFEKRSYKLAVYSATGIVVFLLYPGICKTCFKALSCRQLGPGLSVLYADYSVDCNSTEYLIFRAIAIAVTLLLPIGLPLGAFYLMWRDRIKILAEQEDVMLEFDSLLGDYKVKCYYWEIVQMCRKLTLAGFIMFVEQGSSFQTATALCITSGFFAAHIAVQPFAHPVHNNVYSITEFTLFMVLLVLLLQAPLLTANKTVYLGYFVAALMIVCAVAITVLSIKVGRHIIGDLLDEQRRLKQEVQNAREERGSSKDLTKSNPVHSELSIAAFEDEGER